jgi:hypothetical protein
MRKYGTAAHGGHTSFTGSVAGLSLCVMRAVRFSFAHRRNQVALAAYARSHQNALLDGTRTHCAPARLYSSQPRWLQRPCAGGLARTRTLASSSHTHAWTHTHIGPFARSTNGFSAFEAAALTLIKSVQVSAHLMTIADSLPPACLPSLTRMHARAHTRAPQQPHSRYAAWQYPCLCSAPQQGLLGLSVCCNCLRTPFLAQRQSIFL